MKLLIDTLEKIGSLHHAYILEGDVAELRQQLFAFILDYMKVPLVGNPDFGIQHMKHLPLMMLVSFGKLNHIMQLEVIEKFLSLKPAQLLLRLKIHY
jgi:hypothetical protein